MLEWKIGDCQDLMSKMEPDSMDLVVTDPPYGYSFMNKDWDKIVPSVTLWQEALRVLKPGAFAFIMSAPRQDVLAHNLVNLSDAGFETGFTSIYWVYSSGFPKASNIGKMVDKRLGAKREIISGKSKPSEYSGKFDQRSSLDRPKDNGAITPEAKALDGSYSGFQPKPALEVIMVVMKPLSESTYIDQSLVNQKGITWLDDGRIPYQSDADKEGARFGTQMDIRGGNLKSPIGIKAKNVLSSLTGRFPANLLVSDDVLNTGQDTKSPNTYTRNSNSENKNCYGKGIGEKSGMVSHNFGDSGSFSRYFDLDAWFNTKFLSKEAQKTFPFLIIPKASKSEKGNVEIDNSDKYNGKFPCSKADRTKNKHPTVKPVKLFSWLMTIGSRKGDLVLDPFLGSGTALEAGYLTGRDVLGFELDPQWEKLYDVRAHTHQGNLGDWF